MNHILELPGLREDNPRDFLAALGLLRMLNLLFGVKAPRLCWEHRNGVPIVHTTSDLPVDYADLIWKRVSKLVESPTPTLEPTRVMSVSSQDLRTKFQSLVGREAELEMNVLLSIASQLDIDAQSRRSEFIIESGQIIPLKGICESLSKAPHEITLEAALMGSAKSIKLKHTPRWNPSEFRSAAYTTTDPAKTDFLDHPELNILAFVGLTYYPVVDSQRGATTTGFSRSKDDKWFTWPIWSEPLTSDEITSLLHHPEVHVTKLSHLLLSQIGIDRVWRTRKFGDANNKYFSTAMPA